MPNFTYSARDNSGKEIKGKLEARDSQAVAEILQDRGLIVVNIKEKKALDFE
jgi:type II secretory pathway component PulF